MGLRAVAAAAWLFCLAPGIAAAQGDASGSFSELVATGVDHYKSGRYDAAIATFESAYELRQAPELLYNIARSHEKLGHVEQAIEAYRNFVGQKGTTAQLRAKALDSINALERERRALRRASRPAPVSEPALTVDTKAPPSTDHTAELILIAAGGVAVLTGGVFGILAIQENNRFGEATERSVQERLRDSTKRNALIADVTAGVGAACLAAGLIIYLVRDDSGGEVAFAPAVSTDGIALAIDGRF